MLSHIKANAILCKVHFRFLGSLQDEREPTVSSRRLHVLRKAATPPEVKTEEGYALTLEW